MVEKNYGAVIHARNKEALDNAKASGRRGRDTISLMQSKSSANGQDLGKTILLENGQVKGQ